MPSDKGRAGPAPETTGDQLSPSSPVAPRTRILPLVPRVPLPCGATGRTRPETPDGYGTQEQCLPFVAGSALGFLIPSPITFGYCLGDEVPPTGRAFRSPVAPSADGRAFYVVDDDGPRFRGNAFAADGPDGALQIPGVSFFERPDQAQFCKLHLPYLWRTPPNVATLFTGPINRAGTGLRVVAGLVETDWYANPVNLVLELPAASVHVTAGEVIAQAVPQARWEGRPSLEVLPAHARDARVLKAELGTWQQAHRADRDAYKRLAHDHRRFRGGPSG